MEAREPSDSVDEKHENTERADGRENTIEHTCSEWDMLFCSLLSVDEYDVSVKQLF